MFTKQHSKLLMAGALVSILVAPSVSMAASVQLDNVTGKWQEVPGAGGDNVAVIDFGTGNKGSQISWGASGSNTIVAGRSGFQFNPIVTPTTVETEQLFALGQFNHVNNVINGDGPTDMDLVVTIDFPTPPDPNQSQNTFGFTFLETPNGGSGGTCPDGGGPVGSCPDLVGFDDFGIADETITIDGEEFFFQIIGFTLDPEGTNPVSTFLTAEGTENPAYLQAKFTQAPVPVPSAFILFGTGLAAMLGGRYMLTKRKS